VADPRTIRMAWALLALTGLIAVAGAALTIMAWGDLKTTDAYSNLAGSIAGVLYAALGVLVVRRVRNVIGWILLAEGVALAALNCFGGAYSVVAIVTRPGSLPAPRLVGTIAEWSFVPILAGVALLLLLFPTGTLPSRRWRPFAALVILVSAVSVAGLIWTPRLVSLPVPGGLSLKYPNPFGVESLRGFLPATLFGTYDGLAMVSIVFFAGPFVALVARYRRGDPVRRQQIKWLAFTAVAAVAFQLISAIAGSACGCDLNASPVPVIASMGTGFIAVFGIPTAIAIAILKYRLYEIDRIINRALVYGLLTAILAGVYVGLAVGLGALAGSNANSLVIAGSTLVVAALFRPARRRIQELIDRRFYRRKYDSQRTLEAFSARLRDQVDLDELHSHLITVVDETVRPASIQLWLREARG
jgi:hypothetical protein